MHQKRLAAGLRPDPLGELKRPPRPPSRTCGRFAARVGASQPWRQGAICRGSSCQNDCLAAGLRQDLLSELRCFPDLIFRPQHHQKGLAAGLHPDPLGELERSPRPPSAVSAMEGNTLAAVFSHHKITINVWRPGSTRTRWGALKLLRAP